jgi:hypothetical protein
MTLFAARSSHEDDPPPRKRRQTSTSLRAKTSQAKRTKAQQEKHRPAATDPPGQPLQLSAEAQALFDDVNKRWQLSSPVAALLRLACEAMSKAAQLEEITAREGMTVGDQKGSSKPHPAALLARDYRAQASGALQRLLTHLEA